jgi:hypothetical protein
MVTKIALADLRFGVVTGNRLLRATGGQERYFIT